MAEAVQEPMAGATPTPVEPAVGSGERGGEEHSSVMSPEPSKETASKEEDVLKQGKEAEEKEGISDDELEERLDVERFLAERRAKKAAAAEQAAIQSEGGEDKESQTKADAAPQIKLGDNPSGTEILKAHGIEAPGFEPNEGWYERVVNGGPDSLAAFNEFAGALGYQSTANAAELTYAAVAAINERFEKRLEALGAELEDRILKAGDFKQDLKAFLAHPDNKNISGIKENAINSALYAANLNLPKGATNAEKLAEAKRILSRNLHQKGVVKDNIDAGRDLRPYKKAAKDAPDTAGSASGKNSGKPDLMRSWEEKADREWKWR